MSLYAPGWNLPANLFPPLTREQRIEAHYLGMTGGHPVGPNHSAIAAILAHHMVDLEDAKDTEDA